MYVKLIEKHLWTRIIVVSFGAVTALYALIGIYGYYVFGSFLARTDNILDAVGQTSTFGQGLVIAGRVGISLHVAGVLPILANPVFLAVCLGLNFFFSSLL